MGKRPTKANIASEIVALDHYLHHVATTRRMQMAALGAMNALKWISNMRNDMNPMRLLSLTDFALKLSDRRPVRFVPEFRQRQRRR